jgi:hypothetical protein
MVQRSTVKILGTIVGRMSLLIIVLTIGYFTAQPFQQLNEELFNFINPPTFFMASWADGVLAWCLSSVLWGAIIFGTLGRKIDYIFLGVVFLFALWNYVYTQNVTPQMYLGLIGVAAIGIFLGFCLKLLRQRIWSK